MRNLIIICAVILFLIAGGISIFVQHRNGNAIRNGVETLTTFDIIEILSKVDPPFPNTNTLLLESGMKLCGDTPNGFELPLPPKKEDLPCIEKLRTWAHSNAPGREDFDRILDTIVIYSAYEGNNFNQISERGKIYVLVKLEKSKKNGQFFIYENYLFNDTLKQVVKEFKIDRTNHMDTNQLTTELYFEKRQ